MALCFCACHEWPGTYPPPCNYCGHHNDHGSMPGTTRDGWEPYLKCADCAANDQYVRLRRVWGPGSETPLCQPCWQSVRARD